MCCAKASLVTPTFQFFFGDAEIIKAVLCSDTCVLSSDVCVLRSEESTQKKIESFLIRGYGLQNKTCCAAKRGREPKKKLICPRQEETHLNIYLLSNI